MYWLNSTQFLVLGFRLLAMPILPISKETLKYGSDDGGKTVHADIPEVN
jgi:hypothetical protein